MTMTLRPAPVPDEEAFAAIKASVDALPPGAKLFLNSGGFALILPSISCINVCTVSRVLWTRSFHGES